LHTVTKDKELRKIRKQAAYPLREANRVVRKRVRRYPPEKLQVLAAAIKRTEEALAGSSPKLATEAVAHLEQLMAKEFPRERKSVARDWLESLGIAVLIALFLRLFVFEAFKIPSGSMYPTLWIGDHIFVNKYIYGIKLQKHIFTVKLPLVGAVDLEFPWMTRPIVTFTDFHGPRRGEVVVFLYPKDPEMDYIKRVIGVADDTITVQGCHVRVNDQELPLTEVGPYRYRAYGPRQQVYTHETTMYDSAIDGHSFQVLYDHCSAVENEEPTTYKVPPGHLFVMGDNRDNSQDSRFWGFVPLGYVKGRAMFVWLSVSDANGFQTGRLGDWIN